MLEPALDHGNETCSPPTATGVSVFNTRATLGLRPEAPESSRSSHVCVRERGESVPSAVGLGKRWLDFSANLRARWSSFALSACHKTNARVAHGLHGEGSAREKDGCVRERERGGGDTHFAGAADAGVRSVLVALHSSHVVGCLSVCVWRCVW